MPGTSSPADGVTALATPLAEAAGLVVESVTVTPAGKRRVLRIVVDLPADGTGGVPMAAVTEVSRAVAQALDESDVMGGTAYVLEVSSPGVDRPLTERRHWLRARGRIVRIEPAPGVPGGPVTGRLSEVDDDGVVLDDGRRVGWAGIASGRVQVEFGRPEDLPDDDDDDNDDSDDSGTDDEGEE
jgi:ribosome maturation factor RimP